MKYFYYLDNMEESSIIRIKAKSKPSKTGTYKVQEYHDNTSWYYGAWTEVSFKTLKDMTYIGSTKI